MIHLPMIHPHDSQDEGTIVRSGSKLVLLKGSGGVTIHEDFECEKGAVFEIK